MTVTDQTEPTAKKKASMLVRLWPVYLIAAVLVFALSQGWHEQLRLENIKANIAAIDTVIVKNLWLVVLVYMAVYAACTVFIIPASFLTIAGGAIFGLTFGLPLIGASATVTAATIGATILFVLAQTSLGAALRQLAGPFMAKMEAGFNAAPIQYLVSLRLAPVVPFSVANIAPALLGARLPQYVITTFFGIMPGTLAYSWVGASAAAVLRDPKVSTDDASAVIDSLVKNVGPALIALFVVSLLPIIYSRFIAKKPAAHPSV